MTPYSKILFYQSGELPSSLPMLCATLGIPVEIHTIDDPLLPEPDADPQTLTLVPWQGGIGTSGLPDWARVMLPQSAMVLYDVRESQVDSVQLLTLGLKGLLFQEERVDMTLSALRALMQGELWFSRATLEKAVTRMIGSQIQLQKRQEQEKLTNREQSVVRLVAMGARNKEIARELFISEYTVKAHLASIFRKTETRNRVELVSKLGLN
ncbi:response regulator transcription factor [Ferrimonas sp. YFM]|uniref:helix-turn-helix transcriptional regulator n=1 Tax=Ferrimonas sp. YFM TaxID=3028878 RepID=UPI002573522B|nr:response regulator transcription factor [Ferrimonas sp. YFM]BDY06540.1 helix-turn-helix transcriptional regulator [Ferrimonas sp. YFM]